MKQAFIYSLKVWVTTVLLSPVVGTAIGWIMSWFDPDAFQWNGLSLVTVEIENDILNCYILLPICLLLWLIVWLVNRTQWNIRTKKGSLTMLGPIIFNGPTLIFFGFMISNLSYLIAYGLVSIVSIWFYKLGTPSNSSPK
jgi:hypothetical protein